MKFLLVPVRIFMENFNKIHPWLFELCSNKLWQKHNLFETKPNVLLNLWKAHTVHISVVNTMNTNNKNDCLHFNLFFLGEKFRSVTLTLTLSPNKGMELHRLLWTLFSVYILQSYYRGFVNIISTDTQVFSKAFPSVSLCVVIVKSCWIVFCYFMYHMNILVQKS